MENSNNLNGSRRIRKSTTVNSKSRSELIKNVSEFLKEEALNDMENPGRSILQPSGSGSTHSGYIGGIIGSKEKVMEAFEDYASQAKILNNMILETESKELEKEFDKLLDMVNLLTIAQSNKNRQDWINAGFEPVQE